MKDILDLDRYPLDREGSPEWQRLVDASVAALEADAVLQRVLGQEAVDRARGVACGVIPQPDVVPVGEEDRGERA